MNQFFKNTKGQVAIFVVLIFQVLFILFAMSINVAMLAYDKINLQNSLDLAAYYGAKKQSEVLSAMAYINYQMRQNWKLLSWRYRILGTLTQHRGDTGFDYWCPQGKSFYDNPQVIKECKLNNQNTCNNQRGHFATDIYPGYCDAYYYVCISNSLWKRGVKFDKENLCIQHGKRIQSIYSLDIISGSQIAMPWIHDVEREIESLKKEISRSCPQEGALNWLMTQFFLTHFRLDQRDRKIMMREIYERTLRQGRDLDGERISDGANKVFCGNLSQTNCKSTKFCSLNNNICLPKSKGNSDFIELNSFNDKGFEDIFKKINVWPVLQFLSIKGDNYDKDKGSGCELKIKPHYQPNPGSSNLPFFESSKKSLTDSTHNLATHLTPEVKTKFKYNTLQHFDPDSTNPLSNLTLSFVKDPKQILYYGLSLEFDYESKHQVFSLRTPIKFKASSFAKPFGSSFGPQPKQIDPLIPVHYPGAPSVIPSNLSHIHPYWFQPNYSRFPGDKWGLIDKRLHDNSQTMNFLNKHFRYHERVKRVYTMEDYFHLTLTGGPHDPLARNNDPFTFTRLMELMAVYPDLYDISYYSILGNYHQTYFPKVCKLLTGSLCDPAGDNSFSSSGRTAYVRGDFGWPDTDTYIKKNREEKNELEISIAPYFLYQGQGNKRIREGQNILNLPDDIVTSSPAPQTPAQLIGQNWGIGPIYSDNNPRENAPPHPLTQGNLFYPWLASSPNSAEKLPGGLLSSWVNPNPLDYREYSFDTNRFLNCKSKAEKDRPVPSDCAAGGRSTYSVKLISCETVKEFENQDSAFMAKACPN